MKIAVLEGDGVSREVVPAAVMVLEGLRRFGLSFETGASPIGGAAMDAFGDALPPATIKLATEADAVLLGAVGTPAYEKLARTRPGSGLLRLRRELGLFANLRPVTVFPELLGASSLKPEVIEGLDLLIIRELNGDLYYGTPRGRVERADGLRESVNTMRYDETEIARIAHVAFKAARTRRGKLCSVDKANVLETMGLWREVVIEVGRDYPDVSLSHLYADAAAMALARAPKQFDVIVAPNLFGDILSDEAAVIGGSIGMLPSASVGEGRRGLYEPIHGSAPDIAGQDIANPLGTILSVAMMLRLTFGLDDAAARIEAAVRSVLAAGLRTRDIAEPGTRLVGTKAMGEAVAAAL